MNIIIGAVILVLTIINDKSFIAKALGKKNTISFENMGTDKVMEFYKTLSYLFLSLFWYLLQYIQFIVPCIIFCNLLAYIHYISKSELIRKASFEVKTCPVLYRMFFVCGMGLGIMTAIETLIISKQSYAIMIGVGAVLYLTYFVRGMHVKAKLSAQVLSILPIAFFVVGSVFAINSFYGVKVVNRVETVVSDLRIGMRVDAFIIPEEDALDGKTRFAASMLNKKVGDKVKIAELEGCLGIRWFETKWVTE